MRKIAFLLGLLLIMSACDQATEFDAPPTQEPEVEVSPPDDSAREELEAYLQTEPVFKADYDVVQIMDGERNENEETVIIKGDNSVRRFAGEAFYVLGDKVYLCESYEEVVCYDIPQEEPPEPVDVTLPENVTVVREGTRMIAGEEAECFRMDQENGFTIDCRSSDGILLYFTIDEGANMVELEATRVSRTVPDSEFELPAEPQPLPEN